MVELGFFLVTRFHRSRKWPRIPEQRGCRLLQWQQIQASTSKRLNPYQGMGGDSSPLNQPDANATVRLREAL